MTAKYYHNPRCSKSRQGLELLNEKGIDFTVVEYLKTGFQKSELESIFNKLGKSPAEVVRSKETIYKELGLGEKKLDTYAWIKAIMENPVLMERPLLVTEKSAVIGRPPEELLTII